jgi:hypothetical protein
MGAAAAQHAQGQQLRSAANPKVAITLLKEQRMKSASELLEAYLNNVSTPNVSAAHRRDRYPDVL